MDEVDRAEQQASGSGSNHRMWIIGLVVAGVAVVCALVLAAAAVVIVRWRQKKRQNGVSASQYAVMQ